MEKKLDYKASLKGADVEEIFDLIIYRPLSFLFVKLIYNTNLTPNQISTAALVFGVLAGLFFAIGSHIAFVIAAISFFICNVLDCADGQLARLKKNGTRVGRIVDGLIDYITGLSTFIGIGLAFSSKETFWYAWILTGLTAISRALHNMYYDYYRNTYLGYVYGKKTDIESEIEEYEHEAKALKRMNGKHVAKFLVGIYLKYIKTQKGITKNLILHVTPEEYKNKNKFLLRLWSWIGSTTHLTALIICALLNRIDLYLYGTIIAANAFFIVLFIIQKIEISKLEKII